ncbi:MAG: glycosyltransferase family 4 protein [Balneolaceae bacterium]|nr:glycosyltransferase family 4 protein [Balneolaceae bacterium]
MKILLIAQFGKNGGTREAFKRILNAHHSKGYETHVVIDPGSDEEIKRFITGMGFTFTELIKRSAFFDNMFTTVFYEHLNYGPVLKQFKPDMVVASIGTTQHALYFFTRKYPMVYLLHTIQKDLKKPFRLFFKMFSLLSDKNQWICGVSRAAAESVIKNWGYPNDQTAVLHNCYRKNHVSVLPVREKSDRITVLTLGHMVEYKNPEVWLDVARRITQKYKNVEFIWLGDGVLLKEFKEKTNDDDRIHFPGFKNDVRKYYAGASIYFQPSKIENHSFSVLDAMVNRLPCVVSNVGGQPDSVQEGINGFLCEPDDKECYIQKISKLIEDSELREQTGGEGKRLAKQNFNPDDYKDKLSGLYKRVLNYS